MPENCTVVFDRSLEHASDLICGANKLDYHCTGLDIERDLANEYDLAFHDFAKIVAGGICPNCGQKTIRISRGIEVGNIFQLGTKYTKSMHMEYTDKDGNAQTPVMGCYGIGVGRLAASVCEAHHDEYGPIWPLSIAPWQVHLCAVRADNEEVRTYANTLYEQLTDAHVEVIYDDRNVSAGIMFSDADLLGVPFRIIVSPRNLKENCCEIVTRDKSIQKKVMLDEVFDEIMNLLHTDLCSY